MMMFKRLIFEKRKPRKLKAPIGWILFRGLQ